MIYGFYASDDTRKRAQLDMTTDEVIQHKNINKLVREVKSGDVVIVTSLSELTPTSSNDLPQIIQKLLNKDVMIKSLGDNLVLFGELGHNFIRTFEIARRVHTDIISRKTIEALNKRKEAGVKLGRKYGTHNNSFKLDGKVEKIKKIAEILNVSQAARKFSVSRQTMIRFAKTNNIEFKVGK